MLRTKSKISLEKSDYDALKSIVGKTYINAQRELEKREGYHGGVSDTCINVGGISFVLGNETKCEVCINPDDLERAKKSIYEAKLQADYIIVSLHSHEMGNTEKEEPSAFAREFSHFCIDNGANAVVGHGPHLLRPIEIYKNRPIFYSLGDFVLQLYNIDFAPCDFYAQYGLSPDTTVHELLSKRSNGFSIGLMTDHRMFESVIPYWESENGDLKSLVLYPIVLSMDGNKSETGLPRLAKDTKYLDGFIERCKAFGTNVERTSDGLLKCSW